MPSMTANSVQVLWGEMHEYGVEPNHRTHIVMDKDPALIDMVLIRLSPSSLDLVCLVKACAITVFCVDANVMCVCLDALQSRHEVLESLMQGYSLPK